MINYIIEFTIILLGFFLYFIFKNFLPSYLSEKAKNLATKEDIEIITEKVEKIKADLSYINQNKFSIKTAEREALFEYNRKFSAWLYFVVRFSFSKYNLSNYKEIEKNEIEFARRQYECNLAEAHVMLFVRDQFFLDLKKDLTIKLVEYELMVRLTISKVKLEYTLTDIKIKNSNTEMVIEIEKELYQKLNLIMEKYQNETIKQYELVSLHYAKLISIINQKIKTLSEE